MGIADVRRRFWRISTAGIFFQGGAAAVDTSAILAALIHRLTGSADLVHLDSTEGVPGPRYRHLWVEAEDINGNRMQAVTYIADGKETDGNPSLRYITLIREGARAHGLPDHYLRFLESVKHAEQPRREPSGLYSLYSAPSKGRRVPRPFSTARR